MQKIIVEVVQRGHLLSKYLNQGVKTVINVEEQTSLLFNTMRSVY